MKIWVDADACPNPIKTILFRAAERTRIDLTLVANHRLSLPPQKWITQIQVSKGFDQADEAILQRVTDQDLVITADIPLAADIIKKGAQVLSPRGEAFTEENIRPKLNVRDFMETMRASGVEMSGGPAALSAADKKAFADKLDVWLNTAFK